VKSRFGFLSLPNIPATTWNGDELKSATSSRRLCDCTSCKQALGVKRNERDKRAALRTYTTYQLEGFDVVAGTGSGGGIIVSWSVMEPATPADAGSKKEKRGGIIQSRRKRLACMG
jgi:hypothetical protein